MPRFRTLSLLLAGLATVWLLPLALLQGQGPLASIWASSLWGIVGAALAAGAVYCAWAQGPTSS
ncbi:MAG: hypothetical protein PHU75_05975 [Candidatus Nanopelagicales bacterium]|nr:hypothetical protein [Candidatus Nanopelagicales bacterium]